MGLDHHHIGLPSDDRADDERRGIVAAKTPLGRGFPVRTGRRRGRRGQYLQEIVRQTTRRIAVDRFETGLLWERPDVHYETALRRHKLRRHRRTAGTFLS